MKVRLTPPVSRFGGAGRAKKKQTVIDKLKAFFERFFGIGGVFKAEPEKKPVTYTFDNSDDLLMVAELKAPYGEKK